MARAGMAVFGRVVGVASTAFPHHVRDEELAVTSHSPVEPTHRGHQTDGRVPDGGGMTGCVQRLTMCLRRRARVRAKPLAQAISALAHDHPKLRALSVEINVRPFSLHGVLLVPAMRRGTVVIASGGPGCLDSPAGFIARRLVRSGFAALVMDFLVPASLGTKQDLSCFDTGLLAARTIVTVDWTRHQAELCNDPIGCMGFGAAGSGMIIAAAERSAAIAAVVAIDARLKYAETIVQSLPTPLLFITRRRDQDATTESGRALLGAHVQHRAVRALSGRAASTSRERLREMSRIAAKWYGRYFQQTAN